MVIKDYRRMIELHHILMEQVLESDDYTNENKTEPNSKWPYIPDHPYRILIIGGSGSGKKIHY